MSQDNFLPYISPPPRRLPPTPTPPGSVPPSSYPSRPLAGGTTWQSTPSSPSSANSSSSILVPPRSSPWTHPSRPLSLSSSTNMSGPYPPTSYRDSSRGSRRPDSVDFSVRHLLLRTSSRLDAFLIHLIYSYTHTIALQAKLLRSQVKCVSPFLYPWAPN